MRGSRHWRLLASLRRDVSSLNSQREAYRLAKEALSLIGASKTSRIGQDWGSSR
jgi:hypothetical protein